MPSSYVMYEFSNVLYWHRHTDQSHDDFYSEMAILMFASHWTLIIYFWA